MEVKHQASWWCVVSTGNRNGAVYIFNRHALGQLPDHKGSAVNSQSTNKCAYTTDGGNKIPLKFHAVLIEK